MREARLGDVDWIELRLVIPRESVGALTSVALAHGAPGVQEAPPPGADPGFPQPWDDAPPPETAACTLVAWVPPARAEAAAAALGAAAGAPVERAAVREEDWAETWKRHHRAVRISPRLRVAPPWEARPGDLVIPPGNAFGTGDHFTTRACLEAIDREARPGLRVLDVGCGSGVLALAAAKLGARAEGVDIDPAAVATARENAAANGLEVAFSAAPLGRLAGPYALVVANLFAEVLRALAPELIRLTGARLVLAGVLTARAHLVIGALEGALALDIHRREGEWSVLEWTR